MFPPSEMLGQRKTIPTFRIDIHVLPLPNSAFPFQATLWRDAGRQLSRRREQGHAAAEGRNRTPGKITNDNRLSDIKSTVDLEEVPFLSVVLHSGISFLMDW